MIEALRIHFEYSMTLELVAMQLDLPRPLERWMAARPPVDRWPPASMQRPHERKRAPLLARAWLLPIAGLKAAALRRRKLEG